MPTQRTTFTDDFRRFFGRGLAVLLPSVLTLWILWYAFVFVFNNVADPINRGLRWAVLRVAPSVVSADESRQPAWYRVTPQERDEFLRTREGHAMRNQPVARLDAEIRAIQFRQFWAERWYLSATGLVVAIVLIYLAGLVLGGLIGRQVYARVEAFFARLPGFKQVYPHVKQLVDLVMGERPMAFKRVVLVEYPRQGTWSLGLVTAGAMRRVEETTRERCVTVFIPSTPTPFTGFAIVVPESQVIDLPISIDEAIRYVLTGGVLIPESQATGPVRTLNPPAGASGERTA